MCIGPLKVKNNNEDVLYSRKILKLKKSVSHEENIEIFYFAEKTELHINHYFNFFLD